MVGTLVGAVVSETLMIVIEMSSSNLGILPNIVSGAQLARGLSSIAGTYAPFLLGLGLIGASFLALTVVSLGSAWGLVEAMGFKRERAFPLYLVESIPALIITFLFLSNLMDFMLQLMVVFVFVLIGPALIMGLLSSSKKVMGKNASTTLLEGRLLGESRCGHLSWYCLCSSVNMRVCKEEFTVTSSSLLFISAFESSPKYSRTLRDMDTRVDQIPRAFTMLRNTMVTSGMYA